MDTYTRNRITGLVAGYRRHARLNRAIDARYARGQALGLRPLVTRSVEERHNRQIEQCGQALRELEQGRLAALLREEAELAEHVQHYRLYARGPVDVRHQSRLVEVRAEIKTLLRDLASQAN